MKNVLLLDSGSGGVNILKQCVQIAPHCNFLMFCDDKNFPYGNKAKDELLAITFKNLEMIKSFFTFDIVIFACNTLTSVCIDQCRKRYRDVIFIGTEPAIKPALEHFCEKDVLVLATENTLKNNKLIKSHKELVLFNMPTLASEIDKNMDNLHVLKNYLIENLSNFDAKAIVLGCTHYFAIKDLLLQVFPGVDVFDSARGVANRLLSFVEGDKEEFQVQIMTSGDFDFIGRLWWFYNH